VLPWRPVWQCVPHHTMATSRTAPVAVPLAMSCTLFLSLSGSLYDVPLHNARVFLQWPVRRSYFQQCCDRRLRDGYAVQTPREIAVQNMFDSIHAEVSERTGGGGGH